jgi:hypothetical protein
MDLMKSILGDYSKLKILLTKFDTADTFWINQQNIQLFRILSDEFQNLKEEDEHSITEMYDAAFSSLDINFKDTDLTPYESLFETDFNFEETILNYFLYFKKKEIHSNLIELTNEFQSKDILEIHFLLHSITNKCYETFHFVQKEKH